MFKKAKSHLVHNSLKEVKITKLIPNLSTRLVFNIEMSGLFHDILFYFICYILYNDLLYMFDLTQHIDKPTRISPKSATCIDLIISNNPKRVTFNDVLPCTNISDHDGPYACINIRTTRFMQRYKYIRNESQFREVAYVEDVSSLPLSIIYGIEDPNEKLEIFNNLLTQCIDRHAPLTRVKLTRPPAPWLNKNELKQLQSVRNELRHEVHSTNTPDVWQKFRDVRNLLKRKKKRLNKHLSTKP